MMQHDPQDFNVVKPKKVRGKTKKGLHKWLLVIIMSVATPTLLWQAYKDNKKQQSIDNQPKPQHTASTGHPDILLSQIAQQKKEGEQLANKTTDTLTRHPQQSGLPPITELPILKKKWNGTPPIPNDWPLDELDDPPAAMTSNKNGQSQALLHQQANILGSELIAISPNQTQQTSNKSPRVTELTHRLDLSKNSDIERLGKQTSEEIDRALSAEQNDPTATKTIRNNARQNNEWLTAYQQIHSSHTQHTQNTAEPPISSYTVCQGSVVPSVLMTDINSDLPGMLVGQTTQDVYDCIKGYHLLIPKGSKIIGAYNNDVRIGQERVMAAFNRIIYPNGYSVNIGGMMPTDAKGQSGLIGEVNNHFWKMFGASFFIAGIARLVAHDQPASVTIVNSSRRTLADAAGEVLVDTAKTVNQRSVIIPPTLIIQHGHRFNLMVTKDLVLQPYSHQH